MKKNFIMLLILFMLTSAFSVHDFTSQYEYAFASEKKSSDSDYDDGDKEDKKDNDSEKEDDEEEYKIHAGKYLLYDVDTGSVIMSYKSGEKINPSGFVKILTAMTAIENSSNPEKKITVPKKLLEDYDYSKGNIGLASGEKIALKDLIIAMLIRDAGDCALVIANTVCESQEEFIKKMNETAKNAGAENSKFTNATGFSDKNQYSTLDDMLKISRYAFSSKTFCEYISKSEHTIEATNMSNQERKLYNENYYHSRFYSLDYYNENVRQSKTAFPSEKTSGIIAHYDNGINDMIVLCTESDNDDKHNYAYKDVNHLIDLGKNNFTPVTLNQRDEIITEVGINNGENADHVLLVCSDKIKTKLEKDYDESKIERKVIVNENISAPIRKGEVLGELVIYYGDREIGKTDLIAFSEVDSSVITLIMYYFNKIISSGWFITVIVLLIVAVLFRAVQVNLAKKRKKR